MICPTLHSTGIKTGSRSSDSWSSAHSFHSRSCSPQVCFGDAAGRTQHISWALGDLVWSPPQHLVWSHSSDPKAFKAGVMGWDRKGEEEKQEGLGDLSGSGEGWGSEF